MKVLEENTAAKNAAKNWKESRYVPSPLPGHWKSSLDKAIYEALLALGNNPSWDDVRSIIGLPKGCVPNEFCLECHSMVPVAVQFGEEPNYGLCICKACLIKALALLEERKP